MSQTLSCRAKHDVHGHRQLGTRQRCRRLPGGLAMIGRTAALVFAALLPAGCTTADAEATQDNPDFTCNLVHPSKSVSSLRRLPAPIRATIKDKIGPMADRGAFFNAGDVVIKPGPFDRFIRGGEVDGHWFVWYEHGGFAYWKQIVIFRIEGNGKARETAETRGGRDLCADTDGLLDKAANTGP
jgi:hypothetical protein